MSLLKTAGDVTLVFVPGLLSDARVWAPVRALLGLGGYAADVDGPASITGMAERVLAAVDGPLIVLGHSMGGRVGMEMARIAPDRMRGLVLADTGHHPLAEGETATREAKIAQGHADMGALCDAWLPPMVDDSRHGDYVLMGALREMVLAKGPQVHEAQIRALMGRPDAGAYLAAVHCPILLSVGRNDRWSPVSHHDEIAAMAPEAEVAVIEGAGHFLPIEKPVETANVIADWMRRKGLFPAR
ncbi:alpha/beta hydrolase [Mesobacterium sp. TK19101]|uniref:Alpha/beta hydrolase n=1 Tax=Mesobacterium hydrothermale TaxID=3111907 RepID=A0ABU6HHG9_9RHOB|nr:alpha/beta hydrolase [Mesobacterium sp. TK19101]MEC3861219.1 alpha/beta hydrolase [Mesobacterium sp. TK19101]